MPFAKKRRGSLSNEYKEDDTSKRLKKVPSYNPQEICQDLYEIIRNQKTEDGRLLCEPFIRAPKRRNEPDYYATVNIPMDLLKIQHRLKSEEYDDVEEMAADFQLMINNARAFYQPDSMEYKCATELWDLFQHSKTQLVSQALGDCIVEKEVALETDEEASTNTTMSDLLYTKRAAPQSTPLKVPILKLKVVPNLSEPAAIHSSSSRNEQAVDESSSCFSNVLSSGSDVEEETTRSSKTKRRRRTKKAMLEAMMGSEEMSTSCHTTEDDEVLMEQLFSATVTASDDNRCLTDMFRVLPSRSRFPEYYQVIKDPMDLRLIARKIQSSQYVNVDALLRDILLIIGNAKIFNEPGSQIYKDATSLKKFVLNKKQELEQARQGRSQRTRGRSVAQQQNNLSVAFAAMKAESEEESGSGLPDQQHRASDGECSEEENDQWFLYNAVKYFKDASDQVLCEPFLRLPSRRFYPDYYLEIKRPMSIMKIQKKIKSGAYQDLDGVAGDFNLVFNNAKQYNREDSRIYQDADTLQKIMQSKYLELMRNKEVTHEVMEQNQKGDVDVEEGRRRSASEVLKKNLYALFRTLFEFKVGERHAIDLFVTLPSKKDYPDYYRVVSQPIDMTAIDHKIRSGKYPSIHALASDFELMFRNARHYNEETSQVYKDAEMMEKAMHFKLQQVVQAEQANRCLSPAGSVGTVANSGSPGILCDKAGSKNSYSKLHELFTRIKDTTDSKGRILSTPFMKLPHKNEYPDYYEVISRPMDLLKIQQKMLNGSYSASEDALADISLVFSNACAYNDPDSQIHKDAVTLMRVCNEGRAEMNEESMKQMMDVPSIVQKMMLTLIQLTSAYSDKEGRCYGDTFDELLNGETALRTYATLEEMVQRVEAGAYKRLDCLQDDLFKLCEHARNQSTINSQLYEDAVEVQDFFIRQRDVLCKQGDVLQSPALQFTLDKLYDSIVREKRDKMAVDSLTGNKEEEEEEEASTEEPQETLEHDGELYSRGDFVLVRSRESSGAPHVVSVERVATLDGRACLHGCWFLRPEETFHVPSRKFMEREVFKSEFYETVPFSRVVGRCHVMNIHQFITHVPLEFPAESVYVCESKYSSKKKAFRKIKNWLLPNSLHTKLTRRDRPFIPARSSSVQSNARSLLVAAVTHVVEKQRVPVVLRNVFSGESGTTFYEQTKVPACWIRIGDCVAVKNACGTERSNVIRVDKIWTTSSGEAMLSGMLFLHPADAESGGASRLYYKKELLLSNREETRSCCDVVQVCSVLSSRDYCACRYTEVRELDVYVCDFKFNEADRTFKKFNKPLKHPCLSSSVCEDEILFFRKPIVITREPLASQSVSDVKCIEEESMDFCSSVGDQSLNESSSFIGESVAGTGELTPNIKKRKKRTTKIRNITGYIVYAGECRKDIQAEFPDLNFGDISRAVGTRWKNLPKEAKEKYEEKARILLADANSKANESQFSSAVPSPGAESRSMSPNSSITPAVKAMPLDPAVAQPLTSHPLSVVQPNSLASIPSQTSGLHGTGQPLFVGVPPRTQRIVHSEAYLRYIHNLACGNKRIGDFDKTFAAKKPDIASVETGKLPSHWLGSGPGHHGDVMSALWAMREHMLRGALNV